MNQDQDRLDGLYGGFGVFREEIERSLLRRFDGEKDIGPSWQVRYSDDPSFNAEAGLADHGMPRYTFYEGAYIGLFDACMTLACNPAFCPYIPMPKEGLIKIHDISPPSRFYNYGYCFEQGRLRLWPSPLMLNTADNNSPRARLGNHLLEMATRFLSCHEQAHFTCGHIHYLEHGRVIEMWGKQQRDRENLGLSSLEFQALEMQADRISVDIMTYPILYGSPHFTKRGFWLPSATEPISFLFFALLGMAIVIGIIDRAERAITQDPSSRTHPSATARFLVVAEAVLLNVFKFLKERTDRERWIGNLLAESIVLFSTIGCSPFDIASFNEYFQDLDIRVSIKEPEKWAQTGSSEAAKECFNTGKLSAELWDKLTPHRRLALRTASGRNSP